MNSTTEVSDESLMARLADGDDLALSVIMQRWEAKLAGFILRYTNNYSVALDLAQETFVRVYENRSNYKTVGKFSTWMFTIAVNLCRNHARWKSRHPSVSGLAHIGEEEVNERAEIVEDTAGRPDSRAIQNDEAEQIREAVQELPHDLRTAVILFEFEGMAHAEIAKIEGCSPKAIETRLYRARQLLRERLRGLRA